MDITPKDRFWMNCRLFQVLRFVLLNLKILKAVDRAKRA